MLHNVIKKQMAVSTKRKSVLESPSSKNEYSPFLLNSPKLPLQFQDNNPFFSRRNSTIRTNSQDFTNAISNMNNIVLNLDHKNQRVWELEEKLKQISELLFGLYEKLKESLIIDEIYDKDLKSILFNEEIIAKIKFNEPKITIELIKNIIDTSLNFREMVQQNFKKNNFSNIKDYDLQQDYILLIHKYETDIRELKNNELQLNLLLESSKNTVIYYESQNKYLIENTKIVLSDFKNDYLKLLEIVKEKEREITLLDENLKKSKDINFVLQDRLLSINVLEKKISVLDEKFQKDAEKLKRDYDSNIKRHFHEIKNDPIFVHKLRENENKISELEKKVIIENLEKSNLIGSYEGKMNKLRKNNKSLQIKNFDISKQLIDTNQIIIDQKKDSYLSSKNHLITGNKFTFEKAHLTTQINSSIRSSNGKIASPNNLDKRSPLVSPKKSNQRLFKLLRGEKSVFLTTSSNKGNQNQDNDIQRKSFV